MSNDNIILELFNRVKCLENKVKILEDKLIGDELMTELTGDKKKKKITRNIAVHHVIEQLRKKNKNFDEIYKGNRSVEGDILLVTKSKKGKSRIFRARFFHSKSHKPDYVSGWHSVSKEDIENKNYDMYIFTVAFNLKIYTFLILHDELKKIISNKQLDQKNELYHFYFNVIGSDKIVETRDGEIDVTSFYERWNLPF